MGERDAGGNNGTHYPPARRPAQSLKDIRSHARRARKGGEALGRLLRAP